MVLTNPIWLWALAGLSIPIAIHLLSRKEGQIIRIGSLRHLQETNTQQFKGIRLNEIVLLMLRCTLIILFVVLMSGLSFEGINESESKWVLIEKDLEKLREVRTQIDSFQAGGYELRWLAEKFPRLQDSASFSSPILYWKLLEQLQSEKISDVIIVSKNRLGSFKGKRPQLAANVRWISVPMEAEDFILHATTRGDSVAIRKGYTQADKTYFTTQTTSSDTRDQSVQLTKPDTIEVVIVSDDQQQYDKGIVEAALRAMSAMYPLEVNIIPATVESFSAADEWCIWLADKSVPESLESNTLYLNPGINQEVIVQENSNRWIITKRLNEEVALNESFTVRLASLLLSSELDWRVAYQNDRRMLADETAWSKTESDSTEKISFAAQAADSYLLILLLVTLMVERMLSHYRKQ